MRKHAVYSVRWINFGGVSACFCQNPPKAYWMTQSSFILKFLFREPSTQWQLNASTCDHVHVIIWNKTCFSVFWTNCPDYTISFHGGIQIFNSNQYLFHQFLNITHSFDGIYLKHIMVTSQKKAYSLAKLICLVRKFRPMECALRINNTFAGVHCKKKFVESYLKPNLHKLYIIGKVLNVLPNIIFSSLSLIANQLRHNDISMSELIRYQIWLH